MMRLGVMGLHTSLHYCIETLSNSSNAEQHCSILELHEHIETHPQPTGEEKTVI